MQPMKSMNKRAAGFSMIELLICVAVILILAAILLPKLLAAKEAANEADATGALKNMMTQQIAYSTSYGGFSATLPQLGPQSAGSEAPGTSAFANLVDWSFSQAITGSANVKSGSQYTLIVTTPNVPPTANDSGAGTLASSFSVDAVPVTPGQSGTKWLCMTESGVIHVNPLRGTSGGPSGGAAACSAWPAQ